MVFISNCAELLDYPVWSLVSAASLTWVDKPVVLAELECMQTQTEIMDWLGHKKEKTIFVFDQINAIEIVPQDYAFRAESKQKANHFVRYCSTLHKTIWSTSANTKSYLNSNPKGWWVLKSSALRHMVA